MSHQAIRRVCVLWAGLGPYHIARLKALHRRLSLESANLIAIEVTAPSKRPTSFPFRHEALWTGIPYKDLPAEAMRQRVRQALDRHQPDAVAITSYSTPDARSALRWCRRHRKTAVMLFDSRREDTERSGWREALKQTIASQFDAALVAGTPQRAYAVELGISPDAVFTPFDVVDNASFSNAVANVAPDTRRGFLTVARLAPVKNLDGLLAAYGTYREGDPDPWPLWVVGGGPERDVLERLAPPGVTFTGPLTIDDLQTWYGRAGAFVLPSHKDTWGLVVNEAMASGLPVLVSNGAGCAQDLVDEGSNGFRFSPTDTSQLADLLTTVAASSTETRHQMGERSREIISAYRPKDFADGLWDAIQVGTARANRPLGRRAAIVLGALRLLARGTRSFQTIPD